MPDDLPWSAPAGPGWPPRCSAAQAGHAGHRVRDGAASGAPARAAQRADGPVLLDNGQHILIGAYTERWR
jgi:hypothetical protein